MIKGHGDDGFAYGRAIVHDFSSNVIAAMRPKGLLEHLQQSVTIVGHYPQPAAEQLAAGEFRMRSGARVPIPRSKEAAVRARFKAWMEQNP